MGTFISTNEQELPDQAPTFLEAHTQPYALKGVSNQVPVVITLRSGASNKSQLRPPAYICLILDTSGSMDGERIVYCKKAIDLMISELKDGDVVNVFTYNNTASNPIQETTIQGSNTLKVLRQQIMCIRASGGTNMYCGLELALSQLKKSDTAAKFVNRRTFLFSDGEVNQGRQDNESLFGISKEFHDTGFNISSFGIGEGYNEILMKGIAEAGHGGYFFLSDSKTILIQVNKGMKVLTDLVGFNILLQVQGVQGSVVKKVIGYPQNSLVEGVDVGDITENDVRATTFELEVVVPPGVAEGEEFECLHYSLGLETLSGGRIHMPGVVKLKATDDRMLAQQQCDAVRVALALQRSSEEDGEVAALLRENKVDEAIERKQKIVEELRQVKTMDTTDVVQRLLERAEELLEAIQGKKDQGWGGDYQLEAKEADWEQYGARTQHMQMM